MDERQCQGERKGAAVSLIACACRALDARSTKEDVRCLCAVRCSGVEALCGRSAASATSIAGSRVVARAPLPSADRCNADRDMLARIFVLIPFTGLGEIDRKVWPADDCVTDNTYYWHQFHACHLTA